MIHVLDAGVMIAYLDGEPGASIAAQLLIDHPAQCYAHVMNLTEIYYIYFRRRGVAYAENALQTLFNAGVVAAAEMDTAFWKQVGTIKGSHALSLPDAFCIALAQRLGGTAVTTDHNEFDPLVSVGYCPILFIR